MAGEALCGSDFVPGPTLCRPQTSDFVAAVICLVLYGPAKAQIA